MNQVTSRFPIWPTAIAVALFFLMSGALFSSSSSMVGPAPARAGVGVADENAETLFTASQDGKTIYMWQYYSSKPPKYIGKAEAIASE